MSTTTTTTVNIALFGVMILSNGNCPFHPFIYMHWYVSVGIVWGKQEKQGQRLYIIEPPPNG